MIKNLGFLTAVGLLLSSCMAHDFSAVANKMYNISSTGVSEFDGKKHIRMKHIRCQGQIMLELYQDQEQHNRGIVMMSAGTTSVDNIGNKGSLKLRIDDKVRTYDPIDAITNHETTYYLYEITAPFSNKNYILPNSVIREIASANALSIRITLLNREYVDTNCGFIEKSGEARADQMAENYNQHTSAIAGFRQFVEMMDTEF